MRDALQRDAGPEGAADGAPGSAPRPAAEDAAKLRIALLAGNYNYVLDGASRVLNRLVAHLLERGHEVLVLAPTAARPAFSHAGELHPVPSMALPGKRAEYRLGFGLTPRSGARLDRFRPDLIHVATPDLTGITALAYARARKLPVVASFHTRFDTYARYYGFPRLEAPLLRYMRWYYGRCIHTYPPTASMLEELRRSGVGRELRLWRRGVDGELFNPGRRDMDWRRATGFADDDVVVAFVGRLVLEKGIDLFADAVRQAAAVNPKLRALVVGDGPERAHFEAILPGATFLGHQDGEALARSYASADVFFNPSVTEAAGNVTLEAMASGLPCVAAAALGTMSFVTQGRTGLLVPPDAGAAPYAEALLTLAGDPGLRRRMGGVARARTETDHSWPQILDEVIDHYRDAIRTYRGT